MGNQDLGAQAEIQAKINELLEARRKNNAETEKQLSSQLKLMLGIRDAADGTADGAARAAARLNEVASAQKEAAAASDKASASQKNFTEEIKKAADESEELNKKLKVAAEVAGAFGDALEGAATGTFGLIKAGGNLIGTLFNVGQAILAIPFKLWDAFIQKSMNMPYNPAFAQMKEDVREMFGSLQGGAGGQVMSTYEKLRASQGSMLKETGLSMKRIFGYGVEGRAAMLGFIKDMGGALGSEMGPILDQIGDQIGEVTYAIKGMGLSHEEAAKAMSFFYNSGKNASTMMQDMGKTAAMMAKQTGFNIKTLSKAMVETTQHFPQFAKQGVKAMAEVAHYVHNLGISVQSLKGTFDAFDSFDAAAESASKLSQAFGINIDAMKMVQEQSPTKRMEQLRDAFKQTGKSLNDLSTAQRKHLLESMHINEEDAERLLGEGNKKKVLSESEKAAQAATKAAKDQTAAMQELAKAIKRIIPPDAEKFSGFFDAFTKGFSQGMFYSKNFGGMMRDIQRVFRQIYWLGRDLGKMFFDMFPGMNKIAKGFHEIFNPARFGRFRQEVVKIFTQFFKDLETDPKAGFQKFFDRMKEAMGRIFGDKAGGGLQMLKEGFDKFTSVMGRILGEALKKLLMMVTDGLKNFTDMIRNPQKITDMAGTAMGFVENLFVPIKEALVELGPALGDAFLALLEAAFEKLEPYLAKVGLALAAFFALKFAASLAISLGTMLIKAGIERVIMAKTQQAMITAITQNTAAMNAMTAAGGAPIQAAGAPAAPGGLLGAVTNVASVPLPLLGQAALVIGALALIVGGVLIILAGALKVIFSFMEPTEFMIGAAAIAMIMISLGVTAYALSLAAPGMAALQGLAPVVMGGLGILALIMIVLPFLLIPAALVINSPAIKSMSLIDILKFGLLVAIIVPTSIAIGVVAALAGTTLAPAAGPMFLGLGIMALIMVALPLLLIPAAMVINSDYIKKLDFESIGKFAALMAVLVSATIVIAVTAIAASAFLILSPLIIAGLVAMGLILWGTTKLIQSSIPAIQEASKLELGQIGTFSVLIATLLLTVAAIGGIAAAIGFGAGVILPGLGVMVLIVFGLGVVMAAAYEFLSKYSEEDMKRIKLAFDAIGDLVKAMVPMALAAAAVGLVVSTGIGALGLVAAMYLLEDFVVEISDKLMPKVIQMLSVSPPNPEKAKMVAEALSSILTSLGNFVKSATDGVAAIVENSSVWGSSKEIKEAFGGVNTLLGTLLDEGLEEVLNKIIVLSSKKLSSSSVEMVKAIGGMLQTITAMMAAIQPSKEALKAAEDMNEKDSSTFFTGITGYVRAMSSGSVDVLAAAAKLTNDIITTVKDIKVPKGAGELVKSVAEIFRGIASVMEAFKPDSGSTQALSKAVESGGGEFNYKGLFGLIDVGYKNTAPQEIMKSIDGRVNQMKTLLLGDATNKGLLSAMSDVLKNILPEISAALSKIAGSGDTKKMEAATSMMGAAIKLMVELLKFSTDSMGQLMKSAVVKNATGETLDTAILDKLKTTLIEIMTNMTTFIRPLMDVIPPTVDLLMLAADKIKNPKDVMSKIGVLTKMFELMKLIAETFGPNSSFMQLKATAKGIESEELKMSVMVEEKPEEHPVIAMARNVAMLAKHLFGSPTAPMQILIDALNVLDLGMIGIIKGRSKVLADTFDAIKKIVEVVKEVASFSEKDGGTISVETWVNLGMIARQLQPTGQIGLLITSVATNPFFQGKGAAQTFKNASSAVGDINTLVTSVIGMVDSDELSGLKFEKSKMKALFESIIWVSEAVDVIATYKGVYAKVKKSISETINPVLDELDVTFTRIIGLVAKVNASGLGGAAVSFNISPVFQNLTTAFSTGAKEASKNAGDYVKIFESYGKIYDEVEKIGKKSNIGLQLVQMSKEIGEAMQSIFTANATLDPKAVTPVAKAISALSKFKGGTLTVTHNIPNVEMKVNVVIDSKEIAKSIINVDVSKEPSKPTRFGLDKSRGPDKTVGL